MPAPGSTRCWRRPVAREMRSFAIVCSAQGSACARRWCLRRATRAGYDMVALAARVLAHGLSTLALPDARRREIALELFRAAGAGGMIGGQALDLEAEAKALPMEALEDVHRRKTGALIAASCVIGG